MVFSLRHSRMSYLVTFLFVGFDFFASSNSNSVIKFMLLDLNFEVLAKRPWYIRKNSLDCMYMHMKTVLFSNM